MKKLVVLFFLLFVLAGIGAEDLFLKTATIEILVNDSLSANRTVGEIIAEFNIIIAKSDTNNINSKSNYELLAPNNSLEQVIEKLSDLGLVTVKKIELKNYNDLLELNASNIEYFKSQLAVYHNEVRSSTRTDAAYNSLFNKEREIEKKLFELELEKNDLESMISYSEINLMFYEKVVQDLDSQDDFVDFINMPGFEAKYFRLEENTPGEMNDEYYGGSLRYMFTKGRTYFQIGVLKPLGSPDGAVTDIVTYGIGKDFYPRYLGQGKNRFLNPFSGFEFGGMILTGGDEISHISTFEPHIGLEFFKNKYVIIDTRVAYLFPLDKERIKTHRGLIGCFAVNFVFLALKPEGVL